ncbi:MAG: acetate kinase [Deltaproteobacteria bacterium]|nr:MAG: acetate kinase [Deltaproteobacteria bacterium]
MAILVLNCGSSSVKFALYESERLHRICGGIAERVGLEGGSLRWTENGKESVRSLEAATHRVAIEAVLDVTAGSQVSRRIEAVGHRVVHGGDRYSRSGRIDGQMLAHLERCVELAPLHNPPNLAGIRAAMELLPDAVQVAVFDTAFHQSMPREAFVYPLPREWYEKHSVRRYGFHGTSHLYVSRRTAALMGRPLRKLKMVTLHIGNGASATAVQGGRSVDTSMGFTPLEGLVMGTRCGWIDPAIPVWMARKLGAQPEEIDRILNRRSGLYGLTDGLSDRRDVERRAAEGDEWCRLAIEVECRAIRKVVGAYAAVMGGLDAVVFTAGVGENSPLVRRRSMEGLEFLGVELDRKRNEQMRGREGRISAERSKVDVWVVPTDEERVIAEDTRAIMTGEFECDDFRYTFEEA